MLFKNITILDENFEIKENMYVGVQGNRIDYIGKDMPEKSYGDIYNGTAKLLMPGFYNSHGHSPMSLMRGYGENMVLQDWLNKRIFPFEDKLDGNAVYWSTLLTMAESCVSASFPLLICIILLMRWQELPLTVVRKTIFPVLSSILTIHQCGKCHL